MTYIHSIYKGYLDSARKTGKRSSLPVPASSALLVTADSYQMERGSFIQPLAIRAVNPSATALLVQVASVIVSIGSGDEVAGIQRFARKNTAPLYEVSEGLMSGLGEFPELAANPSVSTDLPVVVDSGVAKHALEPPIRMSYESKPKDIGNKRVGVNEVLGEQFAVLQEWEGYVEEIDTATGEFTAALIDISAEKSAVSVASERVKLLMSDVADEDHDLFEVGGVFRWSIGYSSSIGGTKRRFSQIVFRRLPKITTRDMERSQRRAKDLVNSIDWK